MIGPLTNVAATVGCNLQGGDVLGFPKWYEYLNGIPDGNGKCIVQLSSLSDVWLIIAAVIEILLHIAAIMAVAYVVYGGIQYTLSQGESEKAAKARGTIINAIVGLAIVILSSVIISFVAGSIH